MTMTNIVVDDWSPRSWNGTHWGPEDAHRFIPISLHVTQRRLLRLLFMSKMCETLPDDKKTLIWSYLPRQDDDEQRERFLWYVTKYELDWDTNWQGTYNWGFALEYFDDPEIMIACMSCHRNAEEGMLNMSRDLLKNKDVVLTAVRHCGASLEKVHDSLKKDRDVVLAAVREDPMALRFADPILRQDKHICLAAVKKHGAAIKHVMYDLHQDPDNEIPFYAVTQNPYLLQYVMHLAHTSTLDYIVPYAVSLDGAVLKFAGNFRSDPTVVLTAVTSNDHVLEYAAGFLKDNFLVVSRAVTTCWRALKHASTRMAMDERVLQVAKRHVRLCEKCRLNEYLTMRDIREDWAWYFPNSPLPDHWGHMQLTPFSRVVAATGWDEYRSLSRLVP